MTADYKSLYETKPTRYQKELSDACVEARKGNHVIQRELERRGLRQYTYREINVVNRLRSTDLSKFELVKSTNGMWTHIPRNTYANIELHPASVLDLRHINDEFYLANLAYDDLPYKTMWVVSWINNEIQPLFDAKPFVKED